MFKRKCALFVRVGSKIGLPRELRDNIIPLLAPNMAQRGGFISGLNLLRSGVRTTDHSKLSYLKSNEHVWLFHTAPTSSTSSLYTPHEIKIVLNHALSYMGAQPHTPTVCELRRCSLSLLEPLRHLKIDSTVLRLFSLWAECFKDWYLL